MPTLLTIGNQLKWTEVKILVKNTGEQFLFIYGRDVAQLTVEVPPNLDCKDCTIRPAEMRPLVIL